MPNSDVPAPTPADMERDLAADLAIVEYAPPGPWHHDPANLWAMVTTQPDGGGGFVARALPVTVSCRRYGERETAAAIAAMRGAWPAAIRRALHAEAECERLRAEVADVLAELEAVEDRHVATDRVFRLAIKRLRALAEDTHNG